MNEAILKIGESVSDGVCIISPAGDIDAHTSSMFRETIEKNIAAGNTRIVYDFSALNYISSAGIGVLNAMLNALKVKGGKMVISGPGPLVLDTLEVMYFTKKVQVIKDIQSAIAEVKTV